MRVAELSAIIAALPQSQAISQEPSFWDDIVGKLVPLVLDEIVLSHDWDFSMREYSSVSTAANKSEYDILGADADCRDIMSIRIGDDTKILTYYRTADMDNIVSNNQAPTSVFGWTQFDRTGDGYPRISLHSTPSSSETLKIRYRKRDVPLNLYPDGFGYVLALGVVGWLSPRTRVLFEQGLKRMVRLYRKGGKDINRTQTSPAAIRSNIDVSDLYGSG